MNDGIEYARLIGVPSSSCEYVRRKKKPLLFKKKNIIKKVNEELDSTAAPIGTVESIEAATIDCESDRFGGCDDCSLGSATAFEPKSAIIDDKKASKREKRLGAIITAQVVAVFLLVAAIMLTNIFWENSGMNTLLKTVFGTGVTEKIADERVYSDFSLNLPVKSEGVTLVKGVISVDGEYALYPVCEGKIEKIEKGEDGKFSITIKHSDNFSSVISGADLVYFTEGASVNRNVPVCHTNGKASVCLYDNGTLLTDYAAVENSIVFNK